MTALLDECAAVVDADVLYDSLDTALYSAFGHPEAVYKQMLLHTDGVQRRRADTMSGLDWAGQHGMVRSALARALPKHDWQVLLIRYGTDDNFTARRAGARLDIAEMLHKKIMPHVPIEFLFSYAIPMWLGASVKNSDLDVWVKTFDFDHKQMTVRLQGIHQLLDAWLSTARSAANDVISSHKYEQASTEAADYVA